MIFRVSIRKHRWSMAFCLPVCGWNLFILLPIVSAIRYITSIVIPSCTISGRSGIVSMVSFTGSPCLLLANFYIGITVVDVFVSVALWYFFILLLAIWWWCDCQHFIILVQCGQIGRTVWNVAWLLCLNFCVFLTICLSNQFNSFKCTGCIRKQWYLRQC